MSGIGVTVPDLFPIMKHLECAQKTRSLKVTKEGSFLVVSNSGQESCDSGAESHEQVSHDPSESHEEVSCDSSTKSHEQDSNAESHELRSNGQESCDSNAESCDTEQADGAESVSCINRVVEMDEVDKELEKLVKCKNRCRVLSYESSGSISRPDRKGSFLSVNGPTPSEDCTTQLKSADSSPAVQRRLSTLQS